MAEQQHGQQDQVKNIFPLHVLKASQNTQIMVQLKSGETYNGVLKSIDKFMNLKLTDALLTDAKGQIFKSVNEVYIRGNVLKYLTLEQFALKKIEGTQYKAPQKFYKDSRGNDRRRDNRGDRGDRKERGPDNRDKSKKTQTKKYQKK